jgi:ribosomal protein S18 acetylase RimI-like enzyme
MSELMLRAAEVHELAAVLAFWRASAVDDPQRPLDTTGAVAALHLRDPDALILAVDGATIVGTIIAGWDGWRCHLYRLAVDPSRRRAGIGRALIAAAEDRFRALGGVRADGIVLDDNDLAQHLWHACGYHRQPECSRWVKRL